MNEAEKNNYKSWAKVLLQEKFITVETFDQFNKLIDSSDSGKQAIAAQIINNAYAKYKKEQSQTKSEGGLVKGVVGKLFDKGGLKDKNPQESDSFASYLRSQAIQYKQLGKLTAKQYSKVSKLIKDGELKKANELMNESLSDELLGVSGGGPKFCPECGAKLESGAKFCPKCGEEV